MIVIVVTSSSVVTAVYVHTASPMLMPTSKLKHKELKLAAVQEIVVCLYLWSASLLAA